MEQLPPEQTVKQRPWPPARGAKCDAIAPLRSGQNRLNFPFSASFRSLVPDAIYLGNRSLRCSSSCIPAVVLRPWSRAFRAQW